MKLEDIGFYTLSDARAAVATHCSPLQRCELLVTQRCNFNCPYCRKLEGQELSLDDAAKILKLWIRDDLQNLRFSGGEPTLWPYLEECVRYCKIAGVKRIAVSTNGSADWELYERLIKAGVNDFSVSLDACCSEGGNVMSGVKDQFNKVAKNIELICSRKIYLSVGVVLTDENIGEVDKIVAFAHSLGVSDIRVIPAAQHSKALPEIQPGYTKIYPILKYRLNNMKAGNTVRGLQETDNHRCPLVLDDMAVWDGHHYPCIIHLREGGAPIGKVSAKMRDERFWWFSIHDTHVDHICKGNCLDVCVQYNNRVRELREINKRNWEK
jgi:molybdenum cofactor biosynthesis enzyme MoaA